MLDTSLWQQASAFAARAHRHQLRRDGRTPYYSHCARVAMTVALKFGCTNDRVLAAALLHDVVEDTDTDYDDLLKRFGPEVADLVAAMTKDMRLVESQLSRRAIFAIICFLCGLSFGRSQTTVISRLPTA